MKERHNKDGARLGKRGYVICTVCKKETEEISKQTEPAYAMHPACTPHARAKQILRGRAGRVEEK